MFMRICFFLQTIPQTNRNHYRASKNMYKVSNKITRKTCSHSNEFLKIAAPKKLTKSLNNTCEKFISGKVGGCSNFTKNELVHRYF